MIRRFTRALIGLVLAGCSSKGAGGGPAPGPEGGAGGGSGGGGSEDPFECPAPGYTTAPEVVPFERLEATVVDVNGAPLPGLRAQACGLNVCLNADTRADGSVVIDSAAELDRGAFKYGLGRETAKFALLLGGGPVHDLGTVSTVLLPDPATGAPLVMGTEVTSGGVTLTLPPEMNPFEIDPFDFDTEELEAFRAARVPTDGSVGAVDPSLELVYALTPVGTKLCPFAGMRVPNAGGWEPGTAVEFLLHGVEIGQEWAPYGGWAKVADGAVSADGATISTAEGGGIPILSAVGIRRGS